MDPDEKIQAQILQRKGKTCTRVCLQFVHHLLEVVGLDLAGHDLHHLLADLTDLLVLGVGRLADLVGALLGETHTEQAQQVTVGGLHVHVGLDHRLHRKSQTESSEPLKLTPGQKIRY